MLAFITTKMRYYLPILLVILLSSCSFNDKELKNGWWKYGEGYHIGDVLNFNNILLSNDTIYRNGIPDAILIDRIDSHFNLTSRKIIIQSLSSNEKGTYHQK